MKKVLVGVLILAVLAGSGFGAWTWYKAKNDPLNQEPVFATTQALQGNLEVVVEGYGPLLPIEEQEINTQSSGTVRQLLVQPGEQVSKGQVIAVLENASLAMEIQQKELELEQKKLQLARRLNTTPDRIDQVGPEQALRIVAPVSGRLSEFTHREKEEITAGMTIGKIVDDSGVVIEALVTSQVYQNSQIGDPVKVFFSEFTGIMDAAIHDIERNPIPGSQGFSYRIQILLDNPGLLKVGMKPQVIFTIPGAQVQQEAEIVRYKTEENIVPTVGGDLTGVFVKNGDWLTKGQLMATVEEGDVMMHILSERLQIQSLTLDLDSKRSQMESMMIRAPIDGYIVELLIHEADQVSLGTKIAKIANYEMMQAEIMVDEFDIAMVYEGQAAEVTADGLPGVVFAAIVHKVALMGEVREGLAGFPVSVDIPAPEGLRGGMNANVSIFIDSRENVVMVPVEAVYEEGGKSYVQRMENQQPLAMEVVVGISNDRYIEVISGLEPGTEVLVGSPMGGMDYGYGPVGYREEKVMY